MKYFLLVLISSFSVLTFSQQTETIKQILRSSTTAGNTF